MQKLLLWATYTVAALATVDLSSSLGKREIARAKTGNKALQDGGLNITEVDVSSKNGSAELKFDPEELDGIIPGTVIQFNFWPKNHSVTESSFADPCKPLAANLSTPTRPGLRTGFVPVAAASDSNFTAFRIMINDTKPMWLYCGQVNHCQKGMSMVINPNNTSGKTLQAYQAAAAQLPLVPVPAANSSATASVAPPSSTTPAITPVSGSPTTTTGGPSLASTPASASTPTVSVFNGGAAPAQRPGKFVVMAGLAVAGVFASL